MYYEDPTKLLVSKLATYLIPFVLFSILGKSLLMGLGVASLVYLPMQICNRIEAGVIFHFIVAPFISLIIGVFAIQAIDGIGGVEYQFVKLILYVIFFAIPLVDIGWNIYKFIKVAKEVKTTDEHLPNSDSIDNQKQ